MDSTPIVRDITPWERGLLARVRFRPEVFLGEASLRNFFHMASGYQYAMQTAGRLEDHNLLPDGMNEFAAKWYGGDMGNRNWYSIITLHESDDTKALEQFFVILDTYLAELGFAPLPCVTSWTDFHDGWKG